MRDNEPPKDDELRLGAPRRLIPAASFDRSKAQWRVALDLNGLLTTEE